MRINQFIAQSSSLSRRNADKAIADGEVLVNGKLAQLGQEINESDIVTLRGKQLFLPENQTVIILNKPVGYVCSRNGQGSKTVYDLLPPELHNLNVVGRLDKDSSGLLLMTNDGKLAQELAHPSFQKNKIYEITLNQPLSPEHQATITKTGVNLADGVSKFDLNLLSKTGTDWLVTMHEGRNRQIRRTFEKLGYTVTKLHRTSIGGYVLGLTPSGQYKIQNSDKHA